MAIKCIISKVDEDGRVSAVCCYSCGYPRYTGKLLVANYKRSDMVDKLLALGSISILGETIQDDKNLNTGDKKTGSFELYTKTMNTGNETDKSINYFENLDAMLDDNKIKSIEYIYVWMNSGWYIRYKEKMIELTEGIINFGYSMN